MVVLPHKRGANIVTDFFLPLNTKVQNPFSESLQICSVLTGAVDGVDASSEVRS
jgi:hypothetical protein